MDSTIRELTVDELEVVVGGDAAPGTTRDTMCVGWNDGFGGMFGFIFYFAC